MRSTTATGARPARRTRPKLRPDGRNRAILRPTPATFGVDAKPRWRVSGRSVLLRLEGAAALGLGALLYARTGEPWLLFGALFLAPDVSFLAYLAGERTGAVVYNLAHSFVGPLALAALGVQREIAVDVELAVPLALVWAAHIGADRLLGFGLKHRGGLRGDYVHTL